VYKRQTSGYSTGRSLEGNKFGGPDVAINVGVPALDALQTFGESKGLMGFLGNELMDLNGKADKGLNSLLDNPLLEDM
jgi:hypothetical protein